MNENFLWVEKYRPKTVNDTVLPANLKATFQTFVDTKSVPNLILAGPAGSGKTTIAKAMLEELQCDYIVINGSLNGNIDTLRNEIQQFASTVSMMGGRKYVILDEADYLNPNSTQPALRNFMEEYSKNCGFILTCNYKNRIIEPLHSRCSVVEFKFSKAELYDMVKEFFGRTLQILKQEGVEFDKESVAGLIKKHMPDWRRVLNELQRYSASGKIDSGILSKTDTGKFSALIEHMKAKSFTEVRKWVGENVDSNVDELFRSFYDQAANIIETRKIPILVMLIAKYQYQAAFVADQEVNIAAFCAEVMIECL